MALAQKLILILAIVLFSIGMFILIIPFFETSSFTKPVLGITGNLGASLELNQSASSFFFGWIFVIAGILFYGLRNFLKRD